MSRILATLVLVFGAWSVCRAAPATRPADADGFDSIFDGKTLDGWDADPTLWSVEDGAITGKSTKENPAKHNTFCIWTGGDVADFTLRCKARIVGGNSGIQYRSKVTDPKGWVVHGYQADFGHGGNHNGKLYDEGGQRGAIATAGQTLTIGPDGTKEVASDKDVATFADGLKDGEWVDYEITADGPHLVHKLNGREIVNVTDNDPKALASGVLAFQIHAGEPMTVQFKDIRLKKLGRRADAGTTRPTTRQVDRGRFRPPGKMFFSDDDGKTWFADDANKIPPFDHNGKQAVRARIYRCADGKEFLNNLEKFSDEDKKKIETAQASSGKAAPFMLYEQTLLVKKPGAEEWVSIKEVQKYAAIAVPRCPSGGAPQPVLPE